ncbi:hypothetical protein [Nocardia sp. XZ_19_385]|uniref:hypothetical protein n=1 Tax=Nocardia sp. XZ_19_385 TaxID=2769488 RepID=UPI00188DE6CD|nr:hypothetical protein [Nocardia sp. XZ_19_385]
MAAQNKRPRPASATDDMLKLHRRTMVLDGRVYTVLTLRPGSDFRFATNRFHETWHVLSDWRGSRALARLLWGLSYQRRPGTLVVIDPAHLDPNPFDAAPSDPIVLVPSDLTVFTQAAATALRRRLPLRDKSQGTVRFQTFGLRPAVAKVDAWRSRPEAWNAYRWQPPTGWARIERVGGMLAIFGSSSQMRGWATSLATLGSHVHYDMDYLYLDEQADGEVQIFRQYRRKVNIARQARTEVLSRSGAQSPHGIEPHIWAHGATVRRRRYPTRDEKRTATD